jgi:hypothetical protein
LKRGRRGGRWLRIATAGNSIDGGDGAACAQVGGIGVGGVMSFASLRRALNATPHVAQNTAGRASRIDRRTVCHPGYLASQRARKRIEEAFACVKTIALQQLVCQSPRG